MGDQPPLQIVGDQINMGSGDYVHGNQDKRQGVFIEWQQVAPQPVDLVVLDAARRHLAALPVDHVPAVAPSLPPGSRMPLSPNPLFVGRDADLQKLAQTFLHVTSNGRGQTAAITGLGGLGKTQLAAEFVHRYVQFFGGGVFWLSFASAEAVSSEVAACGGSGGLNLRPDFAALPLPDQVGEVQAAWQSPLPRLLVFDNCEDEALLQQWRPPGGGCSILLTSRRAHYDPILQVHPLALAVLSRDDSIALLRKHRVDLPADDPVLAAVAEELGDLPLALRLAGSFLAKYRSAMPPSAYLDRLRKPTLLADRSLQTLGISPTKRTESLARTFALSYERLDTNEPTDALARQALTRMACFAPGQPLPRELLHRTLALPDDDPDASLQFEDVVRRLVDLGLLETEGGAGEDALRLHRLISIFVRSITTDQAAQPAVENVMIELGNAYNNQGYPAPLLSLQPHLRVITDKAKGRMDEPAAALCNALGYHLQMIGDYAGARPYYERALQIHEHVLGADHPDTATTLNELGMVRRKQGDWVEGRRLLEQALKIREQKLGETHPATAITLNNLGFLLSRQEDYVAARPYLERALAIREQVLGADHPDTATTLNDLGGLLIQLDDLPKASLYLKRALRTRKRVLGNTDPDTATRGFLLNPPKRCILPHLLFVLHGNDWLLG